MWSFLFGDPLEQLVLFPDGRGELRLLGNLLSDGVEPVSVVPPGCWQGTRLVRNSGEYGFALCSTVMCPAYDDADFRMGGRDVLERYPRFSTDMVRFIG